MKLPRFRPVDKPMPREMPISTTIGLVHHEWLAEGDSLTVKLEGMADADWPDVQGKLVRVRVTGVRIDAVEVEP